MNLNDVLTVFLVGAGIAYLIGVIIGLNAYVKYLFIGNPHVASDGALQENHIRLSVAVSYRWYSVVLVAGAIVLDASLRTDSQFTLKQYWGLAVPLLIAEFVVIPALKRAKTLIWAIWVLRRADEQGMSPKQ